MAKQLDTIPKGAKLSKEDKDNLQKHSKSHGKSHIMSMRMNMLKGKSFEEAHKMAKSKGYK